VRAAHRRERKVEFREDYFDTMPGTEIETDRLVGQPWTVEGTFVKAQALLFKLCSISLFDKMIFGMFKVAGSSAVVLR